MKNTLTDKNGDPVVITASALTPIVYKHVFGGDMLKDLNAIRNGAVESTNIFDLNSKCAFVMAAQAEHAKDLSALMAVTQTNYYEFLDRFSSDYFFSESAQGLVFGTWFNNAEVIDKAKNPQSPQSAS